MRRRQIADRNLGVSGDQALSCQSPRGPALHSEFSSRDLEFSAASLADGVHIIDLSAANLAVGSHDISIHEKEDSEVEGSIQIVQAEYDHFRLVLLQIWDGA